MNAETWADKKLHSLLRHMKRAATVAFQKENTIAQNAKLLNWKNVVSAFLTVAEAL